MDRMKRALVLGATGGVGGAIAAALIRQGWQVTGMARRPPAAQPGLDWVTGDAMRADDVRRAADGAEVIVHAVNPPGYRDWDRLVLPMIDNSIAAARAAGARLVLPGTIYNYDPARTPLIDEHAPQNATSHKGRIRIALEERMRQAAPEVPGLILRAGDFFGPGARSSWFSQAMVRPGRPLRMILNPDRSGGHAWAYLPDLALAFARLLEHPERLAPFEVAQFAGFTDSDGRQMAAAIRRAAGRRVPVLPFPWGVVRALAPLGGMAREMQDVSGHWRHPMPLDGTRLEQLIGPEPRTPPEQAVAAALRALDIPLRAGPDHAGATESETL